MQFSGKMVFSGSDPKKGKMMSGRYGPHQLRPAWLSLTLLLIMMAPIPICARAQDNARLTADALAYIAAHADREEKVMIPMRDGVRLSALILFPKDRLRQNMPSVLFRSPYLIEPGEVRRFARYLQSFLENGYAAVIQNVRGRYFSEGHIHLPHRVWQGWLRHGRMDCPPGVVER